MKTLIAVPCHDMLHAEFTRSLMEMEKPEGTGFAMIQATLIYTARTLIANKAMEAGFDRVLWLDSDMVIPKDALIRLGEDMDQGMDIVCGIYFTRKTPILPAIHSHLHWEVKDDGWVDTDCRCYMDYPKDSIFEIACCGFGCVMTSAKVLKDMNEKYGAPFYPLMGMGEDTTFCFRATQNGYKIHCDSRVKCGHVGQFTYNEETYQAWRAQK